MHLFATIRLSIIIVLYRINLVIFSLILYKRLQAVLDPKVEARVAGVVLTSPAVGVQPSHPIFVVRILILCKSLHVLPSNP